MSAKNIKVGCEIFLIKDDAILLGKRKNLKNQKLQFTCPKKMRSFLMRFS
jgi:hypothetical protein